MVAIRYAIQFSDIDALAITKLDVLGALDEIKVAVKYVRGGAASTQFPTSLDETVEVSYETLPGWKSDLSSCRTWADLPSRTKDYLQYLADSSGRPIAIASVGKDRAATIHLDPWLMPSTSTGSAQETPGS
jgi:adenylosuccinate synthase